MMKGKAVRLTIVASAALLIVGAAAGGWWFVDRHPEWQLWLQERFELAKGRLGIVRDRDAGALTASGFVEAGQVSVTAELGGRILEILADEGDEVQAGQVLVRLDDQLLRAHLLQSEAALRLAQAKLAQAEAGARPTAIRKAEAELAQAQVARDVAVTAWQDALAQVENPQQLEAAITAAEMQLNIAQHQRAQAEAMASAAQLGRNLADDVLSFLVNFGERTEFARIATYDLTRLPDWLQLPPDCVDGEYHFGEYTIIVHNGIVEVWGWITITIPRTAIDAAQQEQARALYGSWQAWLGLDAAEALEQGAKVTLGQLQSQRDNPLTLQAQATAAEAQARLADAAVGLAQAQVEGLRIGTAPERIAVAEAQVDQAQAARRALELQLEKQVLRAPVAGLVVERMAQQGEVALPGAPLLALANLDEVTLTLYVPEPELGRVSVGAPVSVTVDAYPGRTFPGLVSYISSEAEFTPRNVQTREDRVSMVFAVRVRLPNADHALKPGMPADAAFSEGQGNEEEQP